MNAAQISALSQIQAQAIVNARPQTALIGAGSSKSSSPDAKPTPQQIQNQVQLQAQALVHAHTQAQISAGIYKGGEVPPQGAAGKPKPAPQAVLAPIASAPVSNPMANNAKRPPQHQQTQQQSTVMKPSPATSMRRKQPPNPPPPMQRQQHPAALAPQPSMPITHQLHPAAPVPHAATLQPQSSAVLMAPAPPPAVQQTNYMTGHHSSAASMAMVPIPTSALSTGGVGLVGDDNGLGGVVMPATSPEFLAKLDDCLTEFWSGQLHEMRILGNDKIQTEQDFKNHNDLPLARIKRIMKSDEDVRMISAEAPVLFAKACEMFILEMTLRSWNYSENNKRKTLQKEDVKEAIQRTDIFDFLVDVIH